MADERKNSDLIYHAISTLRGWEPLLSLHSGHGRDKAWRIGSLISTLLFAGGEDREPIAVSGSVTDGGTGDIIVVYPTFLVIADVTNLGLNSGAVIVSVAPLSNAQRVGVSSRHNYYEGTAESKRESGIEVSFRLGERDIKLKSAPSGDSSFTNDDAIARAFVAVRDSITRDAVAYAGTGVEPN